MAEQGLPAFRDAEASEPDELIVATEHEGFVRDHIGAHIGEELVSRRLGLSKFQLKTKGAISDLREAVEKTPGAREIREALIAQAAALTTVAVAPPSDADEIGVIARDLRALAAARHGGWLPTVGRNRLVEFPGVGATGVTSYGVNAGSLTTDGVTSYGGGGVPRPISRSKRWSPPQGRASGPGRGVRVGLLDTRVWPHPWLAGGWVARPSDLVPSAGVPGLVAGHATFVAGLILSQAPGATIEVRGVLNERGQGTAWDAAEVIAELGQSSVSVINLSFSCHTADGQPPLVLARAIDRVNSDVVVVAAAGNHAALGQGESPASNALAAFATLPSWPAALDDVVAVGALDRQGRVAAFSPERPWVDANALGVDLRSTYLPVAGWPDSPTRFGAGWAEWSGTSFSAGLVSGAIAAGVDPGRLTGTDVVTDLLATASDRDPAGQALAKSAPMRLTLRTAGWARGSKWPR